MSVAGFVKNLQSHLKDPLYLNSYLLIGMQMLGTIFGFIFWALAARRMPAEAVGLASGALSAAMLLSGLAQVGLGYGLVRNLPKSHNPNGLVTFTLAITTFAGIILSILFLVVVESWSPALATLRQDPLHTALFVILITGWTLSVTTNWIFIAARRVIFSFTRQTSHMVVAVLLLLLFTSMMEDFTAALLAHTIAVVFSVIISLAAFPKALPGFQVQFRISGSYGWPVQEAACNFFDDQLCRRAGAACAKCAAATAGDQPAWTRAGCILLCGLDDRFGAGRLDQLVGTVAVCRGVQ
jgi:O-antigen/teichoic acid export membrane protein